MANVLTDIITHDELMARFDKAQQFRALSSNNAQTTLGDRLRQIVNCQTVSEDFLQDCINDAAILLLTLPDKAQVEIQAAMSNTSQNLLDLSYCCLDDKNIAIIGDLVYLTSVTSLDVSGNQISARGAKYLADNALLTKLDISNNKIGAMGAMHLSTNMMLSSLDVSSNRIGNKGAEYLARNTTLTCLEVKHNFIDALGAMHLARNTTLTSLNLCGNNIGDMGTKQLLKNKTLTTLEIGSNRIGYKSECRIKDMLKQNRRNIVDFRNEVSAIGQGLIACKSLLSPEKGFPKELTHTIIQYLAQSRGLFASGIELQNDINRNLPEIVKMPQL